jgi:hypothetical protein
LVLFGSSHPCTAAKILSGISVYKDKKSLLYADGVLEKRLVPQGSASEQTAVENDFRRTRGVNLDARLKASRFAWTSKTLPLNSLCSYSEIVREARAVFSVVSFTTVPLIRVLMGDC